MTFIVILKNKKSPSVSPYFLPDTGKPKYFRTSDFKLSGGNFKNYFNQFSINTRGVRHFRPTTGSV